MIQRILFGFLFSIAMFTYSQEKKIDNYKYIIVPSKFDFLKKTDQYKTSSLTKFLLEKKGFTVFLSEETLPSDLAENRCLALVANVVNESGMFTTKTKIALKDCNERILYTSKEGRSKEKDYQKSYHQAIRNAFETMEDLKYKYTPLHKGIVVKDVLNTERAPLKASNKLAVDTTVLYAQPIKDGFQVVDTKPEVVFQLLATQVNDLFIIKDKNGIVYKKGNIWVSEFYEEGVLIVKNYEIKF